MNICGVIVSGDDYSTGLSFDEMAYSEDPNLSSACTEGDFITTNFTAGDAISCYSPCPSENIEMCGANGCLSQLDPPICECVSDPWFPEGVGYIFLYHYQYYDSKSNYNIDIILIFYINICILYLYSCIPAIGDPNETEQHNFPTVEPCKPKVENWVVVVIPLLTIVLLVVGLFIYLRKRKKNYKIEEEKNDEISLNKTTDSEDEIPPVIQQQTDLQAVQAVPIENRAYISEPDAESVESEIESSQSDETITSRTDQVEKNVETQRSQSPVTETETESETESELSIRTKTKLIEKEIRKVRKDIDFLKNCDDSSVTGTL